MVKARVGPLKGDPDMLKLYDQVHCLAAGGPRWPAYGTSLASAL